MSVKKFLVLSAAGIASVGITTAALAGGPDVIPPAQPPAASDNGVYIEGMVGYGRINWANVIDWTLVGRPLRTSLGGFIGGGDIGYQWNHYWALELGWIGFPRVRYAGLSGNASRITSGVAYAVAKWMVPLWNPNADLFFKFGVAYRYINFFGARFNFWRPVFAAGMQYMFAQNWFTGIQYMRVFGATSSAAGIIAPSANLFTVSLGYLFAL